MRRGSAMQKSLKLTDAWLPLTPESSAIIRLSFLEEQQHETVHL